MHQLLRNLTLSLALAGTVGCAADVDGVETEGEHVDALLLKPGLFGPDPCATVTPDRTFNVASLPQSPQSSYIGTGASVTSPSRSYGGSTCDRYVVEFTNTSGWNMTLATGTRSDADAPTTLEECEGTRASISLYGYIPGRYTVDPLTGASKYVAPRWEELGRTDDVVSYDWSEAPGAYLCQESHYASAGAGAIWASPLPYTKLRYAARSYVMEPDGSQSPRAITIGASIQKAIPSW